MKLMATQNKNGQKRKDESKERKKREIIERINERERNKDYT